MVSSLGLKKSVICHGLHCWCTLPDPLPVCSVCLEVVWVLLCRMTTFLSFSCFPPSLWNQGKFLSTQKTPFIFEQLPYVEQFYDNRNFILNMCCSPGGSCCEQPVVAVTTMPWLSSSSTLSYYHRFKYLIYKMSLPDTPALSCKTHHNRYRE